MIIEKTIPQLLNRLQRHVIADALKVRRVLWIAGPRQCGKTTLAKMCISNKMAFRTLDDLTLKSAAELDPHSFIQHDFDTLIIDEIQKVPQLLPAIKMTVDENPRPGQFLLTGSANIQSLPTVTESLAGRLQKIRLRPLTQGEILNGSDPNFQSNFLENAFKGRFKESSKISGFDRDMILECAFRGGFPEAIKLPPRDQQKWHRDYIEILLDRDLKDILRIHRQEAMKSLSKIMAAWSGKLIDISAIGASLTLSRQTIETYINALEALYVVEKVNPWVNTDYERVKKHPKIYMTDCGLMASILGWKIDQVRLDGDRSGKLIETFAFNEIAALIDSHQDAYTMYHYRDREKREVDFLIENQGGDLLGIEVKAGSSLGKNDFKHLEWFRDHVKQNRDFRGIVLYTGPHILSFGKNMWGVPFSALWT